MQLNPKYPVYIISKGRSDTRFTSKCFEEIGVPYRIVIEPQEYEQYAATIAPEKILVLPFSNLGFGSIPARNWVWDHALREGAARHWIVDDNIRNFMRFNHNLKVPVSSGNIFAAMEAFVDRYENIALAGPQYEFFMPRRSNGRPPVDFNTRIYSCILIDNKLPHRWRGRYNEDTDLSIRVLKDGYCTALFYAFLQNKTATMKVKGGNTDELYRQTKACDGRLEMARSLQQQHPDIVTIARRYKRWQHHVDYHRFKRNTLVRRTDVQVGDSTDEFGMVLTQTPGVVVRQTRSARRAARKTRWEKATDQTAERQ